MRIFLTIVISPWMAVLYAISCALLYVLVWVTVSFDSVGPSDGGGSVGRLELVMALSSGQSPSSFGVYVEQSRLLEIYAWFHAVGAWLLVPMLFGYLVGKGVALGERRVTAIRLAEQDRLIASEFGIEPAEFEAIRLSALKKLPRDESTKQEGLKVD